MVQCEVLCRVMGEVGGSIPVTSNSLCFYTFTVSATIEDFHKPLAVS